MTLTDLPHWAIDPTDSREVAQRYRIAYSDGTVEYCSPTNRQERFAARKAMEDAGFEDVRIQECTDREWRDA